jgi:hypothetical protein
MSANEADVYVVFLLVVNEPSKAARTVAADLSESLIPK